MYKVLDIHCSNSSKEYEDHDTKQRRKSMGGVSEVQVMNRREFTVLRDLSL